MVLCNQIPVSFARLALRGRQLEPLDGLGGGGGMLSSDWVTNFCGMFPPTKQLHFSYICRWKARKPPDRLGGGASFDHIMKFHGMLFPPPHRTIKF